MNISPAKMTFLTANYGLSPQQVEAFKDGYHSAYLQMAGEIEYSWQEMGYWPENAHAAMIECLCDADRLHDHVDDYMDWCFDFPMKAELAHDLLEEPMPEHLLSYLQSTNRQSWLQNVAGQ